MQDEALQKAGVARVQRPEPRRRGATAYKLGFATQSLPACPLSRRGLSSGERGEKFAQYRSIESIGDYVLVSTTAPLVDRADQSLRLPSVGVTIAVAAIYEAARQARRDIGPRPLPTTPARWSAFTTSITGTIDAESAISTSHSVGDSEYVLKTSRSEGTSTATR